MNKFILNSCMKKFLWLIVGVFFIGWQLAYSQQQSPEVEEQLKRLNEAIKASSGPQAPKAQVNVSAPPKALVATPSTVTVAVPQQGLGQTQTQTPVLSKAQVQAQTQTTFVPAQQRQVPINANTDIHQEAFVETTNTLLPMSPDQIRALHALFDETQRAASEGPGVPPLPTSSALQVRLEPGATPPVVRLSAGIVTSLVFIDSTGAPWPIKAYSIGNPKAFNIQWEQRSNLLLIQSLTVSKTGNLAVVLKNLTTPVMVTLISGQKAVDYRVDLRVPGFGPNAQPTLEGLPGVESPYLLDVLNGIPPPGSVKLVLRNCISCSLWALGKRFYLRTQFTLISPAWISKMSSPDGTNAYELNQTPVLLLSEHGKIFTLRVEGL